MVTLRLFGLALLLALAGCAGPFVTPLCRGDQKSTVTAELLFGRKIGDRGVITDAQWSRFLADEITPRFPAGLTVTDASGQWRDGARIVREPSKVVMIVLADAEREQPLLDEIAAAYKRRFRQQSVGIVIRPACFSF